LEGNFRGASGHHQENNGEIAVSYRAEKRGVSNGVVNTSNDTFTLLPFGQRQPIEIPSNPPDETTSHAVLTLPLTSTFVRDRDWVNQQNARLITCAFGSTAAKSQLLQWGCGNKV